MKIANYKLQIIGYRLQVAYWLIIGVWLLPFSTFSQYNLQLNREFNLLQRSSERYIIKKGKVYRDTLHPVPCGNAAWIATPDTAALFSSCFRPQIVPVSICNRKTKHSLVRRKLFEENLFIVNDTADKFFLTIDPLFNFEFGRDYADSSKTFYKNTRGIILRGSVGKKFSFESSFYENQATFVNYIDQYIKSTSALFVNTKPYAYNVIPGQGRSKQFQKTGYDFAMSAGYISFSPDKHFNFQAGTAKHFIGDGYRSLLLSDNAFNYPFVRITSSFGKFQYTNLYAVFMDLTDGGVTKPTGIETLYQKKAASFQFLSWNVHQRIQLGFFQGMIWQASDSMNRQHLDYYYFSPVIYHAALAEGLAGKNNVLLGWTLKFKITNSISLYGQYMMDDFSSTMNSLHNKTGFQVGVKYFDLFGIRNLHFQAEYNQVRPYSYASENAAQSYTHFNQPLAHPLGANFREGIAFLNYRTGDFFAEVKINYALTGKDSVGRNYGNSIFSSDNNAVYGINSAINAMGQGVKTTLQIIDFHVGYLVNPSTNFNIVVGLSDRSSISQIANSQTKFVYFGIRTSLTNVYYDF